MPWNACWRCPPSKLTPGHPGPVVFGDPGLPRYSFTVCAPAPGLVPCTTGYALHTGHGLEALAAADTIVVPGYLPLEDPGERVCSALRQAVARGARVVSVCTGALRPGRGFACSTTAGPPRTGSTPAELAARYPAVKVDAMCCGSTRAPC